MFILDVSQFGNNGKKRLSRFRRYLDLSISGSMRVYDHTGGCATCSPSLLSQKTHAFQNMGFCA